MTYENGDLAAALDRRHDPHPHPPEGMPERRHCSDKECMEARTRWFLEELLPKLTVRFWGGIVTVILAGGGIVFFINRAQINEHKIESIEYFVPQKIYNADIARVEQNFRNLSLKIDTQNEAILEKLDELARDRGGRR